MKKTLFLTSFLVSCALTATKTHLLNGVTTESGWFDMSKYPTRYPKGSIITPQICPTVTDSYMTAYRYSQYADTTKDAVSDGNLFGTSIPDTCGHNAHLYYNPAA